MRFICIDFESEFSDAFTLKKLSTEAYCRDPRFIAHGAAIKWSPNHNAKWYAEKELRQVLADESAAGGWDDTCLIAWHANFDGLILSHHYNVRPKMWLCPMSMHKLLKGSHLPASLDAVRKSYGMPGKLTPYNEFRGKRWNELSPETQQRMAEGAEDEVNSIWNLFCIFMKEFPREEVEVLSTTIKMFTNPVLRADVNLLADLWESEDARKKKMVLDLKVTEAELQSADKFIALLEAEGVEIEYKDGKNGPIPAIAKSDYFMQDLLEDSNDRIRTLAEARLGVKSTILQTRAETLGTMAQRGPLCVYLSYAGAGTLRPTGGDGCNWLNFKRGSALRRSILAPDGYLLAPIDSSQIELRVCQYLAGGPDDPILQMLREGKDTYADLASKFYGETIYKAKDGDPRKFEMECKRGAGKQGRLMCLGPDTLVLTNNGTKPITAVELTDWLWDGIEWVQHQGLLFQGTKKIIELAGVQLTPDHLVLCGNMWLPAASAQNERTLSLALARGSANLPLPDSKLALEADWSVLWRNAPAKRRNIMWTFTTCCKAGLHVVRRALEKLQGFGLKDITDMPTCAPMNHTVAVCSGAYPLFTTVANQQNQKPQVGPIMEDAASKSTALGKTAVESFWHIWLRFRDGISRNWKLTVSTIKKVIAPATYDLQLEKLTAKTNANFASSKTKLPTYDIAYAGPRNRFTIVSSAGPLIVHNCMYGAAGKQYQKTAKAGLYGPPIDMSREDADRFVKTFRDDTPQLCAPHTGYWAIANKMLARLAGGDPVQWGPLLIKDKRIYMPNGCPVIYDTLEYHVPSADEENVKDFERNGFWRVRTRKGWKKMWGAKLTQNICEAVSRVIVTQAMIRITRMGYRVLNHPYDELLVLIPKDGREQDHLRVCMDEMKREPTWLPGIPLDCEGSLGERYSK